MEEPRKFSKRQIILATLLIAIVIVVVAILIMIPHGKKSTQTGNSSDNPTVSKVEPGQTITKDQIERENLNNKDSSSGTTGTTPQKAPTKDEFYNQILQSNGVAAGANGRVSFGIIKVRSPMTGWYIVTIKSGNLEPANVIFQQTNDKNNPLTIVAGPGTYFPDSIALPDAVRKAL